MADELEPTQGNLADIAGSIEPSAKALLDDMVWWANATKAARG